MQNQPHHRWLHDAAGNIADAYERLHEDAQRDPNRAGLGGEATWAKFLTAWLPPSYEVVTRRYIVPETDEPSFETDIVVLRPGYPRALRDEHEVLASGVAAAFSVKLTADANGIRDGIERARHLCRGVAPRGDTPRDHLMGAYPVGFLAHNHAWTSPGSRPVDNVTERLEAMYDIIESPREMMDLTCISNLATWGVMRLALLADQNEGGKVNAAIMECADDPIVPPVAVLIARLYLFLSYSDPTLTPFADGLRLTGTFGTGHGTVHGWNPEDVYSEDVLRVIYSGRAPLGHPDWAMGYM